MSTSTVAAAAVARWNGRTIGGADLPTVMVAIAGAETGGTWSDDAAGDYVYSGHVCNGAESEGAWQINMNAHWAWLVSQAGTSDPCAVARWLYVPANCAAAAQAVIGNIAQALPLAALHPWTTWWSRDGGQTSVGDGNGSYLAYWSQAVSAVAAARSAGSGPAGGQTSATPSPSTLNALAKVGLVALLLFGAYEVDERAAPSAYRLPRL